MPRSRRRKKPPELVTLTIDSLSHDGRGVASRNGKRVFVEGGLPGEQVVAEVANRRSRFEEGKVVELLEPAANRIEPRCAQAAICGGCSLQHLSGDDQRRFKEQMLREQLHHFGELDAVEMLPITAGPEYGYRRKARLGVRYVVKREEVLVGFREKGSSFIADIERCHVLDSRVGRLLTELRQLIHGTSIYRAIPQIEVAMGDQETALVFRHLEPFTDADLQLLIAFAKEHMLHIYLQPGGNGSVHKLWPEDGSERLHYRLEEFDLEMAFHPMDFTQVNANINAQIVSRALGYLAPQEGERVLDLFCGLGNFTLPIARSSAQVVGVEGSEQMVQRGQENAQRNGIQNAEFYAADLTQDFTGFSWGREQFDKVLIDPPRSGALEIVANIERLRPQRVVYVSCNPATLARDAGELKQRGYQLEKVGIFDMFPHTTHVESLAVFERIGS